MATKDFEGQVYRDLYQDATLAEVIDFYVAFADEAAEFYLGHANGLVWW